MSNPEATVNGEPVEFTYENDTLTWKPTQGAKEDEDKHSILNSDVFAIVPTSDATPSHTVHSIRTLSSPENSALPVPDVELHQTTLTGAPESFITPHLSSNSSTSPNLSLPAEDIHVIISSKSGTGKAAAFFESVLAPTLRLLGLEKGAYQVVHTTSHETISELAGGRIRERAREGVKQTIILLSGDGGVVELLNGLVSAEAPSNYIRPSIILFPFGTGNALFHSTYASPPSPLQHALRLLTTPTTRPLPHFRVTFSSASLLTNEGQTSTPLKNNEIHGCIVASYGFHSTLVADSDTAELRKFGDKRFGIVAGELLGAPHRYKAKLTLTTRGGGEKVVERETHAYILCTLVSRLEKTFTISPHTKPLDEVMRVVHFDSGSGEEIMDVMKGAYGGGAHVERGDGLVGYEEVEDVRVEFQDVEEEGNEGKWLRVCVDGLVIRVKKGGSMRVQRVGEENGLLDIVV